MKSFLASSLVLALFLAVSATVSAAEKPNIIIVYADDQGYGDVSACNPESKIPTPNLDRLATEGMLFTDGHSASGVCTPSRYSLLTGRYHWRSPLQRGVLGGFSRPLIAEDRVTVAGMLREQGYHTACIGKWHLGMDWPLQGGRVADDDGNFSAAFEHADEVDYTAPIQNGPVDRGFDHFYGISASLDMFPYVWIDDRLPTEVASETKAFHRPGPAGPDFEAIDVQPGITDRLVEYIAERSDAGAPFFAYVPLASPHTPIVPTPEFEGSSGINLYADFVLQIDADMGRILDTLDEHGLAEDTIVIFTTDNGCSPQANFGELEAAGHSASYIYRGHKADLYEGGHRVPFLVRWPAEVAAGSRSDQLVGQVDFMATFAELVGAELPPHVGEDSVSFLPALLGEDEGPIRTSLVMQGIDGSFAIRDGQWKLILCPGSGGWSSPRPGRDDTSGLPPFQLFDLEADPGETENLYERHPERVAAMKAMMEEAIRRGRTTPGPDQPNDAEIQLVKNVPGPPAGGKGKAKAKAP